MTTPAELYDRHSELLDQAVRATTVRDYWSAFPESPSKSVYGEQAAPEGERAFRALLGKPFPIEAPGATGSVSTERSPWGLELGLSYPQADPRAHHLHLGRRQGQVGQLQVQLVQRHELAAAIADRLH